MQTLLIVDRAHGVVEGQGDVVLCQRAEGSGVPAERAGAERTQGPAEDAGKHAAEIVYDKIILVIRILVHEARTVFEMELRPEVFRQILRMRVHLHILAVMIQPAHHFFNFATPCIRTAHIHKKDVLGTKFIADATYFAHTGRTVGMFAPDQAAHMVRFRPIGQGFSIHRQDNISVFVHIDQLVIALMLRSYRSRIMAAGPMFRHGYFKRKE